MTKRYILIFIIIYCFLILLPSSSVNSQDIGSITAVNETLSPDGVYNSLYLKGQVAIWADGRGDVIKEHLVENVDIPEWTSVTWSFNYGPGVYSKIRAWDNQGPLRVSYSESDTYIYVTVYFRRTVAIDQIYRYHLAISIENFAEGSGDEWSVTYGVYTCCTIDTFINGFTFPSNSIIKSVTPTPTYQYLNYIEWIKTYFVGGISFTVDYTLSDSILVPMYLQTSDPWQDDPYGRYPENDTVNTIKKWGCNLTSNAMIIDYWGQRSSTVFRTDPGKVNDWLRKNSGYTPHSGVIYSKIVEYAKANGVLLSWNNIWNYRNDAVLDNLLKSGYPTILGVKPVWSVSQGKYIPGHYVVATGKTSIDGHNTYSINDPYYGQTTLYEKWNNSYMYIISYIGTPADPSSIRISAHSPIELVVIDPQGRKSGFDPTTNTVWDEIPGATYVVETISTEDGSDQQLPESKILLIPSPVDGEYEILAFGTDIGDYTIYSVATDWEGDTSQTSFTGVAEVDSIDSQTLDYSQQTGLILQSIYLPMLQK